MDQNVFKHSGGYIRQAGDSKVGKLCYWPQMLSLTTFLGFGFVESRGLLMYSKGSTYQSQRYFNLSMITEVLTINYLCRLFSVDMASSGTLPNN